MRITHITVRNWRNFKSLDVDVPQRLLVVGPNASGKSNLLDAIRFLRDVVSEGGGLQAAINDRGGLKRVRNLAARNYNSGWVQLSVTLGDESEPNMWSYDIAFTGERRGLRRPVVKRESVHKLGKELLVRPDEDDLADPERLTQTAAEQVNQNSGFREIVRFLRSTRYLHLVPQVIRDPRQATDQEEDPFGSDFLKTVARTPDKTRAGRFKKINDALKIAVPGLENLELGRDADGLPHLEARYMHWRERGARQNERDFSDGTLRLIGLLWALQETGSTAGPVLLEEPELSLHTDIVRQLPSVLARAQGRTRRQVILTTH